MSAELPVGQQSFDMKKKKSSEDTSLYLGIYKREPLGWFLVEKLRLSPIMVGVVAIFLYFGVLIILHNIAGHPLPVNLKELFSYPSTYYYYPNLIGVAYDLIGNPLFFVFLVIVF